MQLIRAFLFVMTALLGLAPGAQAQLRCDTPDYHCIKWKEGTTVGGIRLGRHCEQYAGRQNCTDTQPMDQCRALRASPKCTQDSERCILYRHGQCRQWRHEFTCFNENNDMSPAVLISTVFGTPREWFVDRCGDLEGDASCEHISTEDTQGAGTRRINRKDFYRAWWERERTYACRVPGEGGNNCAPLESDPTCVLTTNTCLVEEDGVCSNRQYHYRCGVHSGDIQTSCAPVNVCVGDFCIGVEDEASGDFGTAASWLNVLAEMQQDFRESDETDPNNVRFFQGTPMSCSNQPARRCCSHGGLISDAFNPCPESAEILSDLRGAGATHYVGSSCDIRILGACYKRRHHYCTYKSKFSRVFLEQYKLQVNEGWGTPGAEFCKFITINDLATLDIDAMDFSEIFGDILNDTTIPVAEDIADFYNQRFPNSESAAEDAYEELEQ